MENNFLSTIDQQKLEDYKARVAAGSRLDEPNEGVVALVNQDQYTDELLRKYKNNEPMSSYEKEYLVNALIKYYGDEYSYIQGPLFIASLEEQSHYIPTAQSKYSVLTTPEDIKKKSEAYADQQLKGLLFNNDLNSGSSLVRSQDYYMYSSTDNSVSNYLMRYPNTVSTNCADGFCRKDRFVSQDEKIYWQAYNQTIANNRQKAEAAPANEAIYFLGGPAGAAIRSALAVKGTEELINAVDDASKGEYKEVLKGAGLGGLDLLGARAPAGQGLASRGTSSGRAATDTPMKIENLPNTEIKVVLDKNVITVLPRVEAELSSKDGVSLETQTKVIAQIFIWAEKVMIL